MAEVPPSLPPNDQTHNLELLSGIDYFSRLPSRVRAVREGGRIAVMNMAFMPTEPDTLQLFDNLGQAADLRASVVFGIDAFAMLDLQSVGPLATPFPRGGKRQFIREQHALLDSLADHPNAQVAVINEPKHAFSNLFAGRCHFKTDVTNNYFCLGGVCLQDCHRLDMMVGMEHKATADRLFGLIQNTVESGFTREAIGTEDQVWDMDDQTCVYVDAGVPGQSVIQEDAFGLIDESEAWLVIACQFLPTGRLADHIVGALKRDVDVYAVYNNPVKHDRFNRIHRFISMREKRRRPPQFFEHELPEYMPPLHGKALASEKGAAVGGHNFLDLGVRFGTAEISLTRRTPAFGRAVRNLLFGQIGYEAL